jgi:hypothetical protein
LKYIHRSIAIGDRELAKPKPADGATKPRKERFIETARALECDEDKERFEAKRMAKAKPTPSRAGSRSERK